MTHFYSLTKFGRSVLRNKESRNKRRLSNLRWGHALFNDTGRLSVLLTWRALGGAKQSGDTPDLGIPNQRCYIAGKRCIACGRVQCFTKNGQLLSDPSSCVALGGPPWSSIPEKLALLSITPLNMVRFRQNLATRYTLMRPI